MGLGDFVKKATDPLGWKKKARKKILPSKWDDYLNTAMEFEQFHFNRLGEQIKDEPWRLLVGAGSPLGTKAWSEITGKDLDPWSNIWGGPPKETWQAAAAAGIDVGPASDIHQVAQIIASWYAGGALAQAAGTGLQAAGLSAPTGAAAGAGGAGAVAPAGAGAGSLSAAQMAQLARAATTAGGAELDEELDPGMTDLELAEAFPPPRPPTWTVPGMGGVRSMGRVPGFREGGLVQASRPRRRRYA